MSHKSRTARYLHSPGLTSTMFGNKNNPSKPDGLLGLFANLVAGTCNLLKLLFQAVT